MVMRDSPPDCRMCFRLLIGLVNIPGEQINIRAGGVLTVDLLIQQKAEAETQTWDLCKHRIDGRTN